MPLTRPSTLPLLLLATAWLTLPACAPQSDPAADATADPPPAEVTTPSLDGVAESYVKLVLAVGQHDPGYVDAYYGPEAWQTEVAAAPPPLAEIRTRAESLRQDLAAAAPAPAPEPVALPELRRRYLARQLDALVARVEMLAGARWSFDEESRRLYDAVAPTYGEDHFRAVIDELEQLIAGAGHTEGTFIERYAAFRQDFVIPADKLDQVFRAAVAECRARTAAHLQLPDQESFVIEYVTDKPWSGYNWYQGKYHSLIQVNTDLPIAIDRAVDLACHEGYPGHHVYNMLLEKNLVNDRGWVEYSVYPLYSPQSLIAEGSANFGVEMAFPGDERVRFEQDVLFPLAGLEAGRAETYYTAQRLAQKLAYAGNEAARRYLDGAIDADQAVDWLTRYAAMEPERARQRVSFFDAYRSYVINYNLGQDLVERYVEARAGDDPQRRWQVFGELLSTPRLPSEL